MNSSVPLSNKIVMNKFLWMSHQLRNFNDIGSIITWANAMLHVKSLLLDPLPATPVTANQQQLSPQSSPHTSTRNVLTTNNSHWTHPERSIAPCFQPSREKPLTMSPSCCSNYVPTKPSPLTIFTHRQPTISPTNSLAPSPKRRKIAIPPSVNYHASITNLTNSKSSSQPAPTIKKTFTPTPTTKIYPNPCTPDAWLFCYDNTTGLTYYWNEISGATQRVKPAGWDGNPGVTGMEKFLPITKKYLR